MPKKVCEPSIKKGAETNMRKEDLHQAIDHLELALSKIKTEYKLVGSAAEKQLAKGCKIKDKHYQCGGAYWRVIAVVKLLEADLEEYEGKEHAAFIIRNHGRVVMG